MLTSLENSLTHLPDEPRLTCFAEAIREALLLFEQEYTTIAEGYTWVLDISDILDVPLPEAGAEPPDKPLSDTVKAKLDKKYLAGLEQRSDFTPTLVAFRQHLRALTKRYAPGLFHCYDIPGLPRTNNDMESFFGRLRRGLFYFPLSVKSGICAGGMVFWMLLQSPTEIPARRFHRPSQSCLLNPRFRNCFSQTKKTLEATWPKA